MNNNLNTNVEQVTEKLSSLFLAVEETLTEWKSDDTLKFPQLIGMLALKLNWDKKAVRRNDPIVRFYIHNHSEWESSPGAHGGVQRRSVKEAKKQATKAKAAAKAVVAAEVEARVSAVTDTTDDNLKNEDNE